MLAFNFKTADKLGLVPKAVPALIKVLRMLERRELVKTCWLRPSINNGFNMATIFHTTNCGSVGCIFGWAQQFEPGFKGRGMASPNITVTQRAALDRLYCPGELDRRTVAEA